MNNKLIQAKHLLIVSMHQANMHWNKNWYKYLIILFVGLIIYTKDVQLIIKLQNSRPKFAFHESPEKSNKSGKEKSDGLFKTPIQEKKSMATAISISEKDNPKEKRYKNYIRNYNQLAIEEMRRYKIPASITLAQGLLETDGGKSKLATNNNNHFGIKCFSKKCKKGHCSNFNDDSHKDFFRKYSSAKESYRAHSHFLNKSRYKSLFKLNIKDYKSWAYEIKKCGYATDKKYPEKLINLIKKYELHIFDD